MSALALALHALAATFWVGGMAFAHFVLRPGAAPMAPQDRLALWNRILGRFLPLVGIAILVLIVTGYGALVLVYGSFGGGGGHVHLMQLTGWIMFLLYGHIVMAPWRRFKLAVVAGDLPEAAKRLAQIRLLVTINLTLGVLTVAAGAGGRFLG